MLNLDRLAINQVTTKAWKLPDAVAGYAETGVRGIGIWPEAVESCGLTNTRKLLKTHDMAVSSYCCGSMFVARSAAELIDQRDRNRALVDQAAEIGARCLVCVSGGLPPGSLDLHAARQRTRDGLAELLPYARAAGVTIGIEPIHPMRTAEVSSLSTLREANGLCDVFGAGLGIVVDVYHVWWDPDLEGQLERAKGRIVGFHLCDWLQPLEQNLFGRGMMGDGVIDIAGIRAIAERGGYTGFYEVELVSRLWQERDPIQVVRTCIERYRSQC
jgi:sugar phosphate isomerase/epimerase